MQDYYYSTKDEYIIEVGRDDIVRNPRLSKDENNMFHFYIWEKTGQSSPDNSPYHSTAEFLQWLKETSIEDMTEIFNKNGLFGFFISLDEMGYFYTVAEDVRDIVGVIFQTRKELKKKCFEDWNNRAMSEIDHYNQYICGDVYFFNIYSDGKMISYLESVYDKQEKMRKYGETVYLGCYDNLTQCLFDHMEVIRKRYGDAENESEKKGKGLLRAFFSKITN